MKPTGQEAVQLRKHASLPLMAVGILTGLLVLPTLALHQHGVPLLWPATYVVIISILTYRRYAVDKKLAKTPEWRIPEAQLQFLDILGGWPGGFLAQRLLRHKCSKWPFQLMFWLVVAVYQFIAIDALMDWTIVRSVF